MEVYRENALNQNALMISASSELRLNCFRFIIVFLTLMNLALPAPSFGAEFSIKSCQKTTQSLKTKKEVAAEDGGVWARFESVGASSDQSLIALRLDSKINYLLNALDYICETLGGVPLNDLAIFVNKGVSRLGTEGFKEHQVFLGKPPTEVNIWIQFAQYAKTIENRTLDMPSVLHTLGRAEKIIDQYLELWKKLSSVNNAAVATNETKTLLQRTNEFFTDDPTASQARLEQSKVPYWDVNESSGGS